MINKIFMGIFCLGLLLLAGCSKAQLANPASVYCTEQGGEIEIVTAADGSQSGICQLPTGEVCDEWAYYRGDCPVKEVTNFDECVEKTGTVLESFPEQCVYNGVTYTKQY